MSFRPSDPTPRAPKLLVSALASFMTIVPLSAGFVSGSNLFGQAHNDNNSPSGSELSKTGVRCVYRDISFPEGALIYVTGTKGTQMCVAYRTAPYWDWSDDPRRKDRRDLIILPPEKPQPPCEIRPSPSPKLCACQTGVFSIGSLVDSAEGKGKLYCDKGQWRPATRQEQGLE